MSELATIPKESAKAAQAFADYFALGPSRSLRKLAACYVEQGRYKTETTAFNILGAWSGEYEWQERLKDMALSRAEEANEYRADTWVAICGEYYRRVVEEPAMRKIMKLESLNSIYDRVRPKESETSSSGQSPGGNVLIQFVFNAVTERD